MSAQLASVARPARNRRGEATRQRLMDASIDLLFEGGATALSTVRIAQRAGIAQSGFYKHFKSVDDCVRAKTTQLQAELTAPAIEAIRAFHDTDPTNVGTLAPTIDFVFDQFLRNEKLAVLFFRHRKEDSPLGESLRSLVDQARGALTASFWSLATRMGARGEHFAAVASMADIVLGSVISAAEGLVDGRHSDRGALAGSVARMMIGACAEELSHVFGAPSPTQAARVSPDRNRELG